MHWARRNKFNLRDSVSFLIQGGVYALTLRKVKNCTKLLHHRVELIEVYILVLVSLKFVNICFFPKDSTLHTLKHLAPPPIAAGSHPTPSPLSVQESTPEQRGGVPMGGWMFQKEKVQRAVGQTFATSLLPPFTTDIAMFTLGNTVITSPLYLIVTVKST